MLALAPVAACDLAHEHPAADSILAAALAAGTDTAGMPMHTMPSRSVGSGTMMEEMRATMRAMQSASGDSLRAAVPMHRQMASDMMAPMNYPASVAGRRELFCVTSVTSTEDPASARRDRPRSDRTRQASTQLHVAICHPAP